MAANTHYQYVTTTTSVLPIIATLPLANVPSSPSFPKCDDSNQCTTDTCTASTGACKYTTKTCNDNNPCTVDTCVSSYGCKYTQKSCSDGNPCTDDYCVVYGSSGYCFNSKKSCDDGNSCTRDTCQTSTGNCLNTKIC
eukprot:gene9770-11409_t